ncbi:similar to Saccharomyces cerevisiae YJR085C Putative protein of unknown function [Geotrichum candidum]|uniref:Uncharacterized protein n=2 Tax=Geotrichum candidum TaxID=1173061 RepID=A0A0J9XFN2_GEOCN|nr:similar to Saccharomyces cerevisiae YJR085C Putative protein of unknown function [Geotrichum candidum]
MEHPATTMAILCTAGGIAGFVRRRSIPSLAGGLVTGVLFGTSAYLLKKNADWGLELALAGSAVLAAGSVPRAIRLQKPVPIFLAVLAGVNGVYYSKKYWEFYG